MRSASPDHRPLDRWLAAERAGQAEEADAALRELCARLAWPLPPAGFAARVAARALAGSGVARPTWSRWLAAAWARAAVVLCLTATGWVLLWLPSTLAALAGAWRAGDLMPLLAVLVLHLRAFVSQAAGLGRQLFEIVWAFDGPLANPVTGLFAAICLAASAVAFRFLSALVARDRRWVYADPI